MLMMSIRAVFSLLILIPTIGLTQPANPIKPENTEKKIAKTSFPKLDVKIALEGNATADLSKRLLNEMALSHLKNDEFPAQTDFLFNRAEQEVLDVLRALGYYEPKISSTLQRNNKQTLATFQIHLGEPVNTRKIDLVIKGEGKDLASWKQYKKFKQVHTIVQKAHDTAIA